MKTWMKPTVREQEVGLESRPTCGRNRRHLTSAIAFSKRCGGAFAQAGSAASVCCPTFAAMLLVRRGPAAMN